MYIPKARHLQLALIPTIILITGFLLPATRTASIENYGVLSFNPNEVDVIKDPYEAGGERGIIENYYWVEKTDTITARMGLSFGIDYIVHGSDDDSTDIVEVLIYPNDGLIDPNTGETHKISTQPLHIDYNSIRLMGFEFDKDWKIKKGEWIFRVFKDRSLLVEKKFFIN